MSKTEELQGHHPCPHPALPYLATLDRLPDQPPGTTGLDYFLSMREVGLSCLVQETFVLDCCRCFWRALPTEILQHGKQRTLLIMSKMVASESEPAATGVSLQSKNHHFQTLVNRGFV